MAITFDEALEQLEPRTIWSPEMRDLLEQLRAEYAPTIEMTQEAYNELNNLRSHNGDLDGVFSHAMFPYNPFKQYTTEELAQVWLHPETIKVVE